MMQDLIGFLFVASGLAAFCFFIGGILSAGMNGAADSSVGACLGFASFFAVIALACAQVHPWLH